MTCPIHNAPLRPQGPMVNVVACAAPGCTLFAFVAPGRYSTLHLWHRELGAVDLHR